MALQDVNQSALGIVNEVLRKLGIGAVTNLNDNKLSTLLVDYLNDVVDEVSDFGDWQQMFREATITAQSSVGNYELAVSGNVKNIYEVVWDNNVSPLEVRTIEDIRRLRRISSFGTPRQFAVVGVSGTNPLFRVYPVPTTAATFDIAYYKKPGVLAAVTANNSAVPAFPGRLLIQGVYAKALLQESGGEPTQEYQTVYAEYLKMRQEALNRFNADTGTDTYITPTGSRYA